MKLRFATFLYLFFIPLFSPGVMILDFVYDSVEDQTVATYSGTWDVSAFSSIGRSVINVSATQFTNTQGSGSFALDVIDGPYPWNSINSSLLTGTGDFFSFTTTGAYGPTGFTPSTVISGSIIMDTIDLTELGLSDGTSGTLTGTAGTVNWSASASAIPEPSTYALIAGFMCAAFILYRSRRT